MRIVERLLLSEREKFNRYCGKRLREEPLPDGAEEIRAVAFGKGEAQRMDVYRPAGRADVLPAVVNIHGGGLAMGCREFNRWFNARLCLRGFVVLAPDYRLVPEHSVFDAFVDVAAALDGAADIARQHGGDASRLCVCGDSAGAYLAAFTAAMQRSPAMAAAARLTPPRQLIAAMGLVSGMFYTTRRDKVGLTMPPYLYGRGWKKSEFARFLDPSRWDMLRAMPPTLLVTSGSDMLRAYTLDYARALRRARAPHELIDYPADKRLPHAFCVQAMDEPETQDVIVRMAELFLGAQRGAGA